MSAQARNHDAFVGKVYSVAPGLSAQKLKWGSWKWGLILDSHDGHLFYAHTLTDARNIGTVEGVDWTTTDLGTLREQVAAAWPKLYEAGAKRSGMR